MDAFNLRIFEIPEFFIIRRRKKYTEMYRSVDDVSVTFFIFHDCSALQFFVRLTLELKIKLMHDDDPLKK